MDFKDFLSELIKKEMDVLGKEKVEPLLGKCGIKLDAAGKVLSFPSGDTVAVTQKLIEELCTINPLAKVPARMVSMAYRKFDPNFKLAL